VSRALSGIHNRGFCLKNNDDIGIGFIVGVFVGAIIIGLVIFPQAKDSLEKMTAYLNLILPFAIGSLAASIAYIGNKIAEGSSSRDKYRHKWEKLIAWRKMYSWLSLGETQPDSFLSIEHKTITRLSNYLGLSEDPSQPPNEVKGSLPRFNLEDLSEILQDLKQSYQETCFKLDKLDSNFRSLSNVTESFFEPDMSWISLASEFRKAKDETEALKENFKRCNALRHGVNSAKEKCEETGIHPYAAVIDHLREHARLESPLNYDQVSDLRNGIESLREKNSRLNKKMDELYQSFCPKT
jgi:hypothetical protein